MISNPALVATKCFITPLLSHFIGFCVLGRSLMTSEKQDGGFLFQFYFSWQTLGILPFLCIFTCFYWKNSFLISVMIRAIVLGSFFIFGIQMVIQSYLGYIDPNWSRVLLSLGFYLMIFTTFHCTEFVTIAYFNPTTCTVDDFLLNQNDLDKDHTNYPLAWMRNWISERTWSGFYFHIGLLFSLYEFAVGIWFFGAEVKLGLLPWVPYLGLALCLVGEVIRKSAILTAQSSFNHVVQMEQKVDHILVTRGIYALWRHPSYLGVWIWSIGFQLILVNPFSLVLGTVQSWLTLNGRIAREELKLIQFFGQEYLDYQNLVSSGIPFVK